MCSLNIESVEMTYFMLKHVAAQLNRLYCLIKIVVLRMRKILSIHRTVTLGAFLDIEEAFDSTSFDIIIRQTSGMGLETIFQLVSSMLSDRYS
jgi:hypothetical protein